MAFPCIDCRDCGSHMDPKYDPAASRSSAPVACGAPLCRGGSGCSPARICQYSQSYAEGSSLTGVFYTDAVYFGDENNAASGPAHATYGLPVRRGLGVGCAGGGGGL